MAFYRTQFHGKFSCDVEPVFVGDGEGVVVRVELEGGVEEDAAELAGLGQSGYFTQTRVQLEVCGIVGV